MEKQCAMNQRQKNWTRGRTHTLIRREFATATTTEQISVNGDGNQWREVAGGEEMIRRPEEAEQDTRGLRSLKKFPKSHPWVYISRTCRCDREEQLGGTEMQNHKRLLQLGVTEKFKSVAPRLKT